MAKTLKQIRESNLSYHETPAKTTVKSGNLVIGHVIHGIGSHKAINDMGHDLGSHESPTEAAGLVVAHHRAEDKRLHANTKRFHWS